MQQSYDLFPKTNKCLYQTKVKETQISKITYPFTLNDGLTFKDFFFAQTVTQNLKIFSKSN